jgi:hypothetical protein
MTLPDDDKKNSLDSANLDEFTYNPIPKGPVKRKVQTEALGANPTEVSALEENKISKASLRENETENDFLLKRRSNISSSSRELTVNSLIHLIQENHLT